MVRYDQAPQSARRPPNIAHRDARLMLDLPLITARVAIDYSVPHFIAERSLKATRHCLVYWYLQTCISSTPPHSYNGHGTNATPCTGYGPSWIASAPELPTQFLTPASRPSWTLFAFGTAVSRSESVSVRVQPRSREGKKRRN